jgi:hypothetical protein
MTQSEKFSKSAHRISITAVIIVFFSVGGAIFFGVYGPRIADRLTVLGGIPLSDVMGAAAELNGQAQLSCQHDESIEPLQVNEQGPLLSRLLGRTLQAPNLGEAGYELQKISGTSLPGAPYRCAELVYKQTTPNANHCLALYLAADDGQYVSFDKLGRSHPFMPNNLLVIDFADGGETGGIIFIWSDGLVLYLACVEDEQEFEQLESLLGAP